MIDSFRGTVHGVLLAGLLAATPVQLAMADDDDKFALGKAVFTEQAQPSCTVCHTLEDAGAAAEIGPNLDELKPTTERVAAAVSGGLGIMPAFESLSEEQIEAVAYYVSKATGAGEQ